MIGTTEGLLLAVVSFVGGHFILSSIQVRGRVIAMLGEAGFRIAYSLAAAGTIIWAVRAYGAAPVAEFWQVGKALFHVPAILMPVACILVVAGMTTRAVTMVGGEGMGGDPDAVSGITTITRHPFLWGVTLWSVGHIAANGDLASMIFFGGFALLALGGMAHIDYRRKIAMGPDWGPIVMTTSAIPFLAAIQGRHSIDWPGIGWGRFAGGIALYLILPIAHPWIAGVSILPEFMLDMVR